MKEIQQSGCYKNLENQVNGIMKNCNEGSIRTRYRYLEATRRCCVYLSEEYKLQKFNNLSSKHLISYVEHMKEQGLSAATIKTEIAGIRYFHRHSNSKNILVDNSKLDLTPREFGKINRAWLPQEVESAIEVGKFFGRMDFVFGVRFSYLYSLRLSEICTLRINSLQNCLDTGELMVKGKGGRVRYVPMITPEQKNLLLEALQYAKENNLHKTDYLITDNRKGGVEAERKSLENFLYNHKDKFIQADRQKYLVGNKIRSETLTLHGLRASYSQTYYDYLKKEREDLSEKEIKLKVSEALGHGRLEVTRCYLS